jgi:16S rRNA (guanine527-N7)-methyltransferase
VRCSAASPPSDGMTASEEVDLSRGAAALGVSLDNGSVERIGRFIARLALWNRHSRLTGDRDRRVLVRKHAVDSLAVLPHLPVSGVVVDVGSGAGFPGLVLGCVRPDLELRLIESRRRPASFLSDAIRSIPLPAARVLDVRAEDAARNPSLAGCAGVVLSRAIRLDAFLPMACPLVRSGGLVIAMQTPSLGEEVAGKVAEPYRLELAAVRDYRLPGGERRRLVIFARP